MYPALSILQALGSKAQPVLWVGGEGGMEAGLVQRQNVPYTTIPAAGVHGVGLRAMPGNAWQLVRGTFAARRILRQFQPDVMLFTGGYLAAPMAVAGLGIPSLLYVPDIEPGLALKFLGQFASRIALSAEASRPYFNHPERLAVTGYPIRQDLTQWDRQTALRHFGLDAALPTLLCFGGSKGARSINRALLAILPDLLPQAQVLHISGQLDWHEVQAAQTNLPTELVGRYHPFAYLHEDMGAALSCADLAVSRAGASSLGEYPAFGLPAILVPYPYAWRYQKVNAAYLQDNGAALLLEDERLAGDLLDTIRTLLGDAPRLQAMRSAMRSLACPQAADEIAALLVELAHRRKGGR